MKIPLETYEQQILSNYLRMNSYTFYKSPSETRTSSWKQKKKNKLEWVNKGYPDTTIILKRGSLLFIELKRKRKILKNWKIWVSPSSISIEQKQWINELNLVNNISAEVWYWANEAIEKIKYYESL